MTTQRPLRPIAETGRFDLTFHGDSAKIVLGIFQGASEQTFAQLWAELSPSVPNVSILGLLMRMQDSEHAGSHVSAALIQTLFNRRAQGLGAEVRAQILEHLPYWRPEAGRRILDDPNATLNELHLAARLAPDEMKPRVADLLYEALLREFPGGDDIRGMRLDRHFAAILAVPCAHQEEALQRYLAIPWLIAEIEGRPVNMRAKDVSAILILENCRDAAVLERIADHVLSEPQPIDLLGYVAGHVPSRRETAMNALEAWCDREIPPALASRPTEARQINEWSHGPERSLLYKTMTSLNGFAQCYPDISARCRTVIEKHGIAPYGFASL